jgi:hypothetical protein
MKTKSSEPEIITAEVIKPLKGLIGLSTNDAEFHLWIWQS